MSHGLETHTTNETLTFIFFFPRLERLPRKIKVMPPAAAKPPGPKQQPRRGPCRYFAALAVAATLATAILLAGALDGAPPAAHAATPAPRSAAETAAAYEQLTDQCAPTRLLRVPAVYHRPSHALSPLTRTQYYNLT